MRKWFRVAQVWLTKQYGRGWGGIVEVSEFSAYGITRTVFWYDQDSPRAGDYSPFGTILMNQSYPDGISEEIKDYVFLHEVGHDKLHWLLRLLYWPAILLAGSIALGGIGLLFTIPIELVFGTVPEPTGRYIAVTILVSLSSFVPFSAISWADELYADLHVISYIGLNRYLEIRRHIREQRTPTVLRRIRHSIQYPPIPLIVKTAARFGYDDRS